MTRRRRTRKTCPYDVVGDTVKIIYDKVSENVYARYLTRNVGLQLMQNAGRALRKHTHVHETILTLSK